MFITTFIKYFSLFLSFFFLVQAERIAEAAKSGNPENVSKLIEDRVDFNSVDFGSELSPSFPVSFPPPVFVIGHDAFIVIFPPLLSFHFLVSCFRSL